MRQGEALSALSVGSKTNAAKAQVRIQLLLTTLGFWLQPAPPVEGRSMTPLIMKQGLHFSKQDAKNI